MSFQLVVQLTQEFQKKICSPNISDSTVSKDIKKNVYLKIVTMPSNILFNCCIYTCSVRLVIW